MLLAGCSQFFASHPCPAVLPRAIKCESAPHVRQRQAEWMIQIPADGSRRFCESKRFRGMSGAPRSAGAKSERAYAWIMAPIQMLVMLKTVPVVESDALQGIGSRY